MKEDPRARALSAHERNRRLVASATASRATSAGVDEYEHDRDGDRDEHPDDEEPACPTPAGSHLIFTECGHLPLLPAPIESSAQILPHPDRDRPNLDPRTLVILSEVKRLADPYRDLEVIDSRAPRFNQATIGVLAVVAVASGWWLLLGALGLQLVVGLTLGRRFCLPCVAYFELVQPRFGEGPVEDTRPPRFANLVGAVFLTSAAVAYAAGFATLGAVLGGVVAALALLAATTGFCTGCEAYKLGSFLLGRPFVACPLPPRAD